MRPDPVEMSEHQLHSRTKAALDIYDRTQGNDFDRMRLAVKAAIEVDVCTGCGTDKPQTFYDAIPKCITCCPERDMRQLAKIL